jgi:predicted DsbA family dithiol-disulfide isomerase
MRVRWTLDWVTTALCTAAAALLIVAVGARFGFSRGPTLLIHNDDSPRSTRGSLDPEAFDRLARTGQRLGDTDAPVTIVVFSDYACGHCVTFDSVLAAISGRYPQHVAIVVKHFVIEPTRDILDSHVAAECAADQGRFAAYHHSYFANRQHQLSADRWRFIGSVAGIPDTASFRRCVRSQRYSSRVTQQTQEGIALGVVATPTSFINGARIVGAVSLGTVDSIIASDLNRHSLVSK